MITTARGAGGYMIQLVLHTYGKLGKNDLKMNLKMNKKGF
jgi:hypothetical protein